MPGSSHQPPGSRRRHFHLSTVALCCGFSVIAGCDRGSQRDEPARDTPAPPEAVVPPSSPSPQPPAPLPTPGRPELAAARFELARTALERGAVDEALALLVAALEADPASTEALDLTREILAKTRWRIPETTLDHGMAIDHIAFGAPSSLWVALSGEANTVVRWNLESKVIESVLFPIDAPATRSLVFGPLQVAMITERAGVTLLCDAQSLKPIRKLAPLPELVSPSSVIAFSENGLLFSQPTPDPENGEAMVWQIRDAATGEILSSTGPVPEDQAAALSAHFDPAHLRVLHADGSMLVMPVSPVEEVVIDPPDQPIQLAHAQFAADGRSAVSLRIPGPHRTPEPFVLSLGAATDAKPAAASDWIARFPWSRQPGVWTGLLAPPNNPIQVDGGWIVAPSEALAPIRGTAPFSAFTAHREQWFVGDETGRLTIYQTLPTPLDASPAVKPEVPDRTTLASLRALATCLSGMHYDVKTHRSVESGVGPRLVALDCCDFPSLRRILPSLDFTPVAACLRAIKPRTSTSESIALLEERIARSINSPDPIEVVFDRGDDAEVLAAIENAGAKGHTAAKALEHALASTRPEWIAACLSKAEDLPPLVEKIAISRIAWLQDRKADALTGWPEVFPNINDTRLVEDWDGWEQADFSQALEKLRLCISEELAALKVPENPTPEQRADIAARLKDPTTMAAVGRTRFASACLEAALAFAAFPDETDTSLELAALARNLGEPPAPCLRAEAIALTAKGDYQRAHDRWIMLITAFPVEAQQPGDYAEASYTAFENAEPQQAMQILTTGLHRFPNDGNFALRAGWVALLTGNAERAYRFLLTGRQIGYPEEKLENATALLAIAAMQSGSAEDAAAFYQDLMLIDPAWENPETIETLEWPEEMKASLRQLVW